MGAPNATDTPAAAAADRISRFLASFLPYFGNRYENMLPVSQKEKNICQIVEQDEKFNPNSGFEPYLNKLRCEPWALPSPN